MKKEIDLSDAIGKTFEGFIFSHTNRQGILLFSGETFSTIGCTNIGWNAGDAEIDEDALDMSDFGDDLLINAGVFSQDELAGIRERKRQERTSARELEQERLDREQYERLKKKYEDPQ